MLSLHSTASEPGWGKKISRTKVNLFRARVSGLPTLAQYSPISVNRCWSLETKSKLFSLSLLDWLKLFGSDWLSPATWKFLFCLFLFYIRQIELGADKLWNILQSLAIKTVNSKGNSLTLIAAMKVPSRRFKALYGLLMVLLLPGQL